MQREEEKSQYTSHTGVERDRGLIRKEMGLLRVRTELEVIRHEEVGHIKGPTPL